MSARVDSAPRTRRTRAMPVRWSLVVATVLVLAAIVGLRKSEPGFDDKLAPFVLEGGLQQRVEARHFAVTAKRIKLARAYLTAPPLFSDAPVRVVADGVWLSVLVDVEPLREPGFVSAWLRTRDGREFAAAPGDRPQVRGLNFGSQQLATGLVGSGAYFFDVPPDALEGATLRFFWGLSQPPDMDHVIDIDLGLDANAAAKLRAGTQPEIDLVL